MTDTAVRRDDTDDQDHADQATPAHPLDPATAVFHYAQELFEGLKAYRHADGTVVAAVLRPVQAR